MQDLLRELAAQLSTVDGQVDVLYALTPVVDGQALSGRLLLRLPHRPRRRAVDRGRLAGHGPAGGPGRGPELRAGRRGRRRAHHPALRRHRGHAGPGPPPGRGPGTCTDLLRQGSVGWSACVMTAVQTRPGWVLLARWLGLSAALSALSRIMLWDDLGIAFSLVAPLLGIGLHRRGVRGRPGRARPAARPVPAGAAGDPPAHRLPAAHGELGGLAAGRVRGRPPCCRRSRSASVVVGACRSNTDLWVPQRYTTIGSAGVAAGLALAAVVLRRLVSRPRPDERDVAEDDRYRREATASVIAACGVLVAGALAWSLGLLGAVVHQDCAAGLGGLDILLAAAALAAGAVAVTGLWAVLVPPRPAQWPVPGDRRDPAVGVDTRSPVPPYEQVRAQLAELVAGGVLGPGDGCRRSASWPRTSGSRRGRWRGPTGCWSRPGWSGPGAGAGPGWSPIRRLRRPGPRSPHPPTRTSGPGGPPAPRTGSCSPRSHSALRRAAAGTAPPR